MALRCAASHPALGPSGCGPLCQGPRHLRGTVPSPPYQGPRHLWLGTEAPPLCRLCGCSDHGEGVVHAGSAVPILVPPRMAATWPAPPLCQGPQHLQEGASVPAWGVCARSGVGVSAPSQPGQSCTCVRPNWFPFVSVAACLLPPRDA